MIAMTKNLSQEYLKEILEYDADTGVFTWKVKRPSYAGKVKPGSVANDVNAWGYIRIGIDGKRYMAHRLAWFYVHGEWPVNQIDHVNRDRSDNRICNLRLSTQADNMQNISIPRTNTSGYKGVSWDKRKQKWFAKITHQYKQIALGCYESIEDAAEAYATAKAKFHSFHPAAT